ncbi:sodium:proton antiporter [Patescibacteria group bacterium]|nr:sodium:proton antiporter [Patescibacteria group bacterium]
MLTANATLAIFSMLGISSLAIFWAKRFKLPHTVFLVIIGMGLGLLATIPSFHFFAEFKLTPELLFFLLLPTLIFESAYNINVRRLVEETPIVLILSIVGLLISTICIAIPLFYLLQFFGMSVPFIIPLIFGALISATDPVAVLALFKEFGAPNRLSLIFEGESLFNDATAVALFLVLLEIAQFGFHGYDTVIAGVISFSSMMIGGVLFGILCGVVFSYLIGLTRENETASITLTVVLAHITFILAEILSHHLAIAGTHLPLSPIIATTVAALLLGNYGRPKIHPRAEEFVEKLWGQLAFFANSLIFILIGVLFVSGPTLNSQMFFVVLCTIIIVALARAISIYPLVGIFNRTVPAKERVPLSWQHLLSWGSLRGALAVTMVLLIPADFTLTNWALDMSVRDFLLSLTIGCIAATLFIKAPTMQWFMRKLKLDGLTDIEQIEYQEARALMHKEVSDKLEIYKERGYIQADLAHTLQLEHTKLFTESCAMVDSLSKSAKDAIAVQVLRLFAIGIEKRHLKELYHHDEVNEAVFKRLTGKLQLQHESISAGELNSNMSIHTDSKDVFERMATFFKKYLGQETVFTNIQNNYMYYRAQTIIARKVLKELESFSGNNHASIFTSEAINHTKSLYEEFRNQSQQKMQAIYNNNVQIIDALSQKLAQQTVHKVAEHVLEHVTENELITPKLSIILKGELAASSHK